MLTVYYFNGPRDEDRAIEATIWQPPASKRLALAGKTSTTTKKSPSINKNLPLVFNRVRFLPAPDRAVQLVGGKFEGSNKDSLTGYVTLAEIKSVPGENQWTDLEFDNSQPYRWIRYLAPAGSHGNMAEVVFFSDNAKLSGIGFGSTGARRLEALGRRPSITGPSRGSTPASPTGSSWASTWETAPRHRAWRWFLVPGI